MKIQDILTDESKWTTRAGARNAIGHEVSVMSDDAVCWCLYGAISKAGLWNSPVTALLSKTIDERFNTFVSTWNDSVTFPEVRALIEELDI
jgi:hypothetical protein